MFLIEITTNLDIYDLWTWNLQAGMLVTSAVTTVFTPEVGQRSSDKATNWEQFGIN